MVTWPSQPMFKGKSTVADQWPLSSTGTAPPSLMRPEGMAFPQMLIALIVVPALNPLPARVTRWLGTTWLGFEVTPALSRKILVTVRVKLGVRPPNSQEGWVSLASKPFTRKLMGPIERATLRVKLPSSVVVAWPICLCPSHAVTVLPTGAGTPLTIALPRKRWGESLCPCTDQARWLLAVVGIAFSGKSRGQRPAPSQGQGGDEGKSKQVGNAGHLRTPLHPVQEMELPRQQPAPYKRPDKGAQRPPFPYRKVFPSAKGY